MTPQWMNHLIGIAAPVVPIWLAHSVPRNLSFSDYHSITISFGSVVQ